MKKLLLTLLCFPMIGFGQFTYVPDDNFEAYLENGNGVIDDYVTTASISTLSSINVHSSNISDLTGIEDCTALVELVCDFNNLTTLDLSNNLALTNLICNNNQLTSLDVSQNTALTFLDCQYNQLTSLDLSSSNDLYWLMCYDNQISSLDLSNHPQLYSLFCYNNLLASLELSNSNSLTQLFCNNNQLTTLDVSNFPELDALGCANNQLTNLDVSNQAVIAEIDCGGNQLISLDVSNNIELEHLMCDNNQLLTLDVRNGNNTSMTQYDAMNTLGNPNLTCINVEDTAWSAANWIMIDPQHYFSNNCSGTTSIQEHTTNKEVIKVTDLLGRETKQTNQPFFYIYDDGTVEKRMAIE